MNYQIGVTGRGTGDSQSLAVFSCALSAFRERVLLPALGLVLTLCLRLPLGRPIVFLCYLRLCIMKYTVAFHLNYNLFQLYNGKLMF